MLSVGMTEHGRTYKEEKNREEENQMHANAKRWKQPEESWKRNTSDFDMCAFCHYKQLENNRYTGLGTD